MDIQLFLTLSLVMAIIIILLFVINGVFAKKISAKIRYFMWVIIMIGLLIPLRPSIGGGVIGIPDFTTTTSELAEHLTPETDAVVTVEAPAMPPDINRQDVEANGLISVQAVVLAIWVIVAIGIIFYHLFQYVRFGRSIKRWGEIEEDENTLALFDRVKQEMNLGNNKVKLVVCGFVSTSMLTGFFKPVILLPERNYDDAELELIFRHELIHYRRKDLWVKLLSVIAIAIHWFNPLVYLMNVSLQTEGEASCDQEVLEMSKLKNRHFYAEVIIGMIGKKSGMTTLATNFYGGKKGIKRRLGEIMDKTSPRKSISFLFLILIVMLTVMSGSVFAMQTPPSTAPNTAEQPVEDNDDSDIFELAIAIVGGGVVTEYYQPSDELLLVYVTYDDDIFLVEIDLINQRVIGLSIYLEIDESITDDDEQEMDEVDGINEDESIEAVTDGIPTETPPATAPPATAPPATAPPPTAPPPVAETISREQAAEIALAVAPGRLVEVSRDWENGRPAWWIEIRHNRMVHEFYIDMETGAILEHEFEIDD